MCLYLLEIHKAQRQILVLRKSKRSEIQPTLRGLQKLAYYKKHIHVYGDIYASWQLTLFYAKVLRFMQSWQ